MNIKSKLRTVPACLFKLGRNRTMKKVLALVFILLLMTTAMVGCSQKVATQKSEEELRAEVKAELEAEQKNQMTNNEMNKDALIESSHNYYKFKADTKVYFDINEDGTNEEITYDTGNGSYDDGKLMVAGYQPVDIMLEGEMASDSLIIIKFSDKYGTEMNMIGIFDHGPSADPMTTFYSIIENEGQKSLANVGKVNAMIVDASDYRDPYKAAFDFSGDPNKYFSEEMVGDFYQKAFLKEGEGIEAPVFISTIPQTWFGRGLFTYDANACSLIDDNEKYEEDYTTFAVLMIVKDVKTYADKQRNSNYNIIKAGQNVLLYAADNQEWIAMEAEDGTKGWVHVEDITHDNFEGFVLFG